jgi:hypothetical protein
VPDAVKILKADISHLPPSISLKFPNIIHANAQPKTQIDKASEEKEEEKAEGFFKPVEFTNSD